MASDNGENYTLILPEDLLIKIFFKSSVDSLIRAKCVCKHWYGLIKDPNFAYKHLQYQKEMKKPRLLFQYREKETQSHNYAILDDITQSRSTYHNLCSLHITKYLFVDGDVDGLYCLFNGKDRMVLWNPALMEFKTLPLPPPHFFPHYKVAGGHFGFGKDPITNDYKVVLIRYFNDIIDNYSLVSSFFGSVYTLSTDSWKDLDLGKIRLYLGLFDDNCCSLFLNGIYYWSATDDINHQWTYSKVIVAFDMGKETFRVIPGPDIDQFLPQYVCLNTLARYEDQIAQLFSHNFIHIWLLSEEDIWIKQISVESFSTRVYPLGFWKKEGLFLVIDDQDPIDHDVDLIDYDEDLIDEDTDSEMVLYDFSSQEIRNIGPIASLSSFQTSVYYESLISVQGFTRCEVNLDLWKQLLEFLDGVNETSNFIHAYKETEIACYLDFVFHQANTMVNAYVHANQIRVHIGNNFVFGGF